MFTVTVASCLHSAGHKHNNLVVSFHIKVLLILQTAAADDDVHRPAALWLADDSTLLEKSRAKDVFAGEMFSAFMIFYRPVQGAVEMNSKKTRWKDGPH